MVKIAINGLGRIGRLVLRAKFEGHYPNIEITAVNSPASIEDQAHLIKFDSVHGRFSKEINVSEDNFIIENQKIKVSHNKTIESIEWGNIPIILECSGRFNKRSEIIKHIKNGAEKVLISAPCEDADKTIVYGVNHENLTKSDNIISIGSCTTNALAPIAKILDDSIGIEYGFMTTIHSYTNDQNIIDASHTDIRRARGAALSMIPTKTGAASAIGLVLPSLKGKLSGGAIRVPTPNVSVVDLSFVSQKETDVNSINKIIEEASKSSFKNIIDIAKDKLVSVDFNHTIYSAIFDPFETNVTGNKFCRVLFWYDNEWAFANRMLDMVNLLAKDL